MMGERSAKQLRRVTNTGTECAKAEIKAGLWSLEILTTYFKTIRLYSPEAPSYEFDRSYCAELAREFGFANPYDLAVGAKVRITTPSENHTGKVATIAVVHCNTIVGVVIEGDPNVMAYSFREIEVLREGAHDPNCPGCRPLALVKS